jgi:hypothetical protein
MKMNVYVASSRSSISFFSGAATVAIILLVAWGCGAPAGPKVPTYQEAEAQAQKDLPRHIPAETTLFDGGLGDAGKDVALPKGTPAPFSGALVGEKRYTIYKAVQIDRTLLIKKYHAEALAARTKEIILSATALALKETAKRDWLERNALWIGIVTGVVLGTALTVGLVYGLTGGEGIK